ncbi:transcription initiation factor TFIID subunit 7-like, partial [Tupaia chinensis]|uniref:transcription initiation factor TFIID subunit 7-like n=1 Tax=Tupaia chinensis TaxID=246437 RepID=UPI0003C8E744
MMERPEGQLSDSSTPTTSTSEVMSHQQPQIPVDHGAETTCDGSAHTAGDQGTLAPSDHGDHGDHGDQGEHTAADSSTQTPAKTRKNIPKGKGMNKSQDELPCELENQFILRLPPEHASTVRKILHSGSADMKDKLKIDLSADKRRAVVEVDNVSLSAKLGDLPCVIGSLKTLDKKTFYKTADISQMLVCTAAKPHQSSLEEPVTSTAHDDEKKKEKSYTWKHGITPPLKNVRKKRFRKVTKKVADVKQVEEINSTEEKNISTENKELSDSPVIPPEDTSPECIESPEVEKEVKRLLCSDAEAASARWEVIAEDETKEIESQGTIPGFPIYPGMSGYKQGNNSSGTLVKGKAGASDRIGVD